MALLIKTDLSLLTSSQDGKTSTRGALKYWNTISKHSLLEASLSELSRTLNDDTEISDDLIFDVYLEWLNMHRFNETKTTLHSQNTLLHWTQSLRARGYSEGRVRREVDRWRTWNRRSDSITGRSMPWDDDIAKAFEIDLPNKMATTTRDEKENQSPTAVRERDLRLDAAKHKGIADRMTREKGSKKDKSFNFDLPPSKNYVCNRCGKQGMSIASLASTNLTTLTGVHHLQACPTNLDPAYDKSPDQYYRCQVCLAAGKHYTSLCPRNTDPDSITQRRKALRMESGNSGRIIKDLTDGWKPKEDVRRLKSSTMEEGNDLQVSETCAYLDTSQHMDPERAQRLGWIEIDALSFGRSSMSTLQASTKVPTSPRDGRRRAGSLKDSAITLGKLSVKPKTIGDHDRKRVRYNGNGPADASYIAEAREDSRGDYRTGLGSPSADREMPDADKVEDVQERHTHVFGFKMRSIKKDVVTESSDSSLDESELVTPPTPPKQYSPFVARLIAKHQQMSTPVNHPPKRYNALEMWQKEEERRRELYGTTYVMSR